MDDPKHKISGGGVNCEVALNGSLAISPNMIHDIYLHIHLQPTVML